MSNELANCRFLSQLFEFRLSWSLRTVSLSIDDAEKPERLTRRGAKLVPCKWGNLNKIVHADGCDFISDQYFAASLNNHHDMGMEMPLQRGVPAFSDFEIAELDT